ncbi:EAL domain-containing protein [Ectobacillus sp. sgz5001026]|uniref:EAL domain-containing protein n=1 Tax=Ectobacillus sp. sgz5001026 TaxID=3242473 RepID=UPI0036D31DEC
MLNIVQKLNGAKFIDLIENYSNQTLSSIIITDPNQMDNPIVYVNEYFTLHTGYRLEEVLGKNCRFMNGALTDKDDLKKVKEAIQNKQSIHIELMNYKKTGEHFWNNICNSPIFDVEGNLIYFISVQQDVSSYKQSEHMFMALNKTLQTIYEGKNLQAILKNLCELVEKTFNYDAKCSILLVDKEQAYLNVGAAPSLPEDYVKKIKKVEIGPNEGSCGSAAYNKKPTLVDDIQTNPLWDKYRTYAEKYNLRACWSFPIFNRNKSEVLGTFAIYFHYTRKPEPFDLELIEKAIQVATIALEYITSHKRIFKLAYFDTVTGFMNQNLLFQTMDSMLQSSERKMQKSAVLFLDLARFKLIVDKYGHAVAGAVIQTFAKRLELALADMIPLQIARYAADEFVFLFSFEEKLQVEQIAKAVLEVAKKPIIHNDDELYLAPSIGISLFPSDASNSDSLIQYADIAMRRAKQQGIHLYEFFAEQMELDNNNDLGLLNDLHKALENEEFILHYQPQVDSKSRKIIGVECLVRWNHNKYGLIPPNRFIPLLEETGLIFAMDEYILRKACLQNKKWQDEGLPKIPMSINVSSKQFLHKNFVETVDEILRETEIDPQYIIIEITENIALNHNEYVSQVIRKLKETGVSVAIDDFGTGYSSLSYLQDYNVDILKIDRSFTWRIGNNSNSENITEAIIFIAKKLGLAIIAEGVETDEQLEFLNFHECWNIQGFLFGKPMDEEKFSKQLQLQNINL